MRKLLGLLAIAGLAAIVSPQPRAEAAVLAPGVAKTVQGSTEPLATEVQYRRHRHYHHHRGYHRRHRVVVPHIVVPRVVGPRHHYGHRHYRRY